MSINKSKTASPTRRSQAADNSRQDFVSVDKELLRGLSEREVEIEHLKTTVIALNQKVEIIRDMEQDVDNYHQATKHSEIKRVELQTHIKETSIKIQEDARQNKQFQDRVIEENMNLQREVLRLKEALVQKERERQDQQMKYDTIIVEKEYQIKSLTETNLQCLAKIREQEQIIRVNADVADQLAYTQRLLDQVEQQKRKLQKELETASDYILALEEKVYKANKTSLELLRQLKDAEIEIETLKNYIIELKQRIAVYIPAKDDAIDRRLAEFINNYPDRQKLKIMFLRESEGVYQFGSKRVAVRVDKDKINIRVGGGYLSIDEFLDQYTPAELEKMERKDPLKKFSEKVAMQKTLVGKEIRESSPIRGSSPTRGRDQ
eukprot:403334174